MATDCVLGIFAKKPVPGQTKTRLAQTTSHDLARARRGSAARRLARSLCRHCRATRHRPRAGRGRCLFRNAGTGSLRTPRAKRWRSRPAPADVFRADARPRDAAHRRDRRRQSDLADGKRARHFALLAEHDIVLGPALDGGYYLIGLKADDFGVFTDIPWSTSRVLEATVARLRDTSARLALSPPWYDVDTADDWALLRGHVLAMRRAGIDPGVPRLEGLILAQSPLAGRASDEVRRTAPLLADG